MTVLRRAPITESAVQDANERAQPMIDTDKMRRLHGRSDGRSDERCDPVEHCRECAVEALCDEVERLRVDLSRKAIEAGILEAHRDRLAQAIKAFQERVRRFPGLRSCDVILDGDLASIEQDFGPLPEAPSDE